MQHFLLYGYGGACNHGSEASVKSEIAFLKKISPKCRITLSSHFPEYDQRFGVEADEIIGRNMAGRTNEEIYAETIQKITPDTICLSVGGDIYCYPNWQRYAAIHDAALKRGAKSYLWRCSLEPSELNSELLKVIGSHHLITARESITYRALIERGVKNVIQTTDMAFALPAVCTELPAKPYIAMNLSPLILRKNPVAADMYQRLIDSILGKLDWNIVLIPHVEISVDHDLDALSKLHGPKDRLYCIPAGLTAENYKYILANAELCVTARTHVAIGAWSSLVPTIVIAYSTKAKGIAADLNQSEFVLDAYHMEVNLAYQAFWPLYENRTNVRKVLAQKIPEYSSCAIGP